VFSISKLKPATGRDRWKEKNMKTLDQILRDNPPFYPDSLTDMRKLRFMFLLEDGMLIGQSEGNHFALLGGGRVEEPSEIERSFCEQNKALRVCFESFREREDGIRGDFWCLYVEIFDALPNDAQWATIGRLYGLKDRRNTHIKWDVLRSDTRRKWIRGEGTINDFRRQLYPPPPTVTPKKRTMRKRKPTQLVKARRIPRSK
jgi:hypothetical protein